MSVLKASRRRRVLLQANRMLAIVAMGAMLGLLPCGVSADFNTTGVYDENSYQTNAVDTSATYDAADQVSLSTFTDWVATAFQFNRGGVIDFDSGSLTDINTIDAIYGVNGKGTLRITNGTVRGMELINPLATQTPISGNGGLKKIFGSDVFDANDFVFEFDPDDGVTAVGITMPSNIGFPSGIGNVGGRARYSDGSS
ncbi:MAG: hypothetical protein KDA63_19425, partial [Planctomycetales bacterium]|nr:hypothetical protein [Planctomycetales bacterium]